jgi:hypothetical protein
VNWKVVAEGTPVTLTVPAKPPGPPGVTPVRVTNSPTQKACGAPVVIAAFVPFPVSVTMLITALLPLTVTLLIVAGNVTVMPVSLPVMELLAVSVTVIDCDPTGSARAAPGTLTHT